MMGAQSSASRTKPMMQTNAPVMGGAPHHMMDGPSQARGNRDDPDLLKFDEIVLESNEIDLADL